MIVLNNFDKTFEFKNRNDIEKNVQKNRKKLKTNYAKKRKKLKENWKKKTHKKLSEKIAKKRQKIKMVLGEFVVVALAMLYRYHKILVVQ